MSDKEETNFYKFTVDGTESKITIGNITTFINSFEKFEFWKKSKKTSKSANSYALQFNAYKHTWLTNGKQICPSNYGNSCNKRLNQLPTLR